MTPASARALRRQRRLRAEGRCTNCAKPHARKTWRCQECADKQNRKRREMFGWSPYSGRCTVCRSPDHTANNCEKVPA